MPKFSSKSLDRLAECEIPLQILMVEAIKKADFTILCGHRNKEEQMKAFLAGASQVKYPNSKHNKYPSQAVDIAPWPLDWKDTKRFVELSKIIKETWDTLTEEQKNGWTLEWGGDWKTFVDYPHYQIVK